MSALCCYSGALPLWPVIIDLLCGCVCRLTVECGPSRVWRDVCRVTVCAGWLWSVDLAACGEAFAVWLCVQAGCGVWTGPSHVWRGICRVAVCAGWLWSVDGTQPRVERRLLAHAPTAPRPPPPPPRPSTHSHNNCC